MLRCMHLYLTVPVHFNNVNKCMEAAMQPDTNLDDRRNLSINAHRYCVSRLRSTCQVTLRTALPQRREAFGSFGAVICRRSKSARTSDNNMLTQLKSMQAFFKPGLFAILIPRDFRPRDLTPSC